MVMRISVVGEELESRVTVNALHTRARDRIVRGVRGDGVRVAACIGQSDRMRCGILSLKVVPRLTQMHRVRTDVAEFKKPLLSQRTLNGQIPLLSIRHLEVARNLQAENSHGRERAGASATSRRNIVFLLVGATTGKAVEQGQTGNEVWIEHACLGQRVWIRIRAT